MPKQQYLLLDSRAGSLASGAATTDLTQLDDDWGRFILVVGNAKWICELANSGDYGDLCVVSTMEGNVLFEWFATGTWKPLSKTLKQIES